MADQKQFKERKILAALVLALGFAAIASLFFSGNLLKATDPSDPRFDPTKFRFESYFPRKCKTLPDYQDYRMCGENLFFAVSRICRDFPTQERFEKIIVKTAGAEKRKNGFNKKISESVSYSYYYPPHESSDTLPRSIINASYLNGEIQKVSVSPYGHYYMTWGAIEVCPELKNYDGFFIK